MFDIRIFHHFPEDHEVRGLLHTLIKQGERIMTQLDDLKAAQATTNTRLDALQTEATEILADIADVISRLKELPPSQDLTEVIAGAQAISDRVESVRAGLDARPPSPTATAQG